MFFILRAQEFFIPLFGGRLAVAIPILLYVLFNVTYTVFAVPSGMLSDKIGRSNVIGLGYALFGVTCLGFAFLPSLYSFIILFGLYGLVYALVDGTQRAFVSDLALEERSGFALGTFHTCIGLSALPASIIAGALWQQFDPSITFLFGSILGFVSSALIKASMK